MWVRYDDTYSGPHGMWKCAFDSEVLWQVGCDCCVSGPYDEVTAMRRGEDPITAAREAVKDILGWGAYGWRCQ